MQGSSIPIEGAGSLPDQPAAGTPTTAESTALADPRALDILTAEHSSLVSARALAYNEAFARSAMFLSFLSATLIVIGFLVASATFSPVALPIAALLLLADLFIGAATVGRLASASGEELHCVRGMNRIRHAYREMVPGLEPYFVTGFHDDARGVLAVYGNQGDMGSRRASIYHGMTTTVGMIAVIDSFVLGALCGVVAVGLGLDAPAVIAVGIVGFVIGFAIFVAVGTRTAIASQERARSRFPSPDAAARG
jgi:hypothetical protein